MSRLPCRVLPRTASAITALISIGAVVSILDSVESRSGLVLLCISAGLLMAVLAVALGCAPRWVWERIEAFVKRWLAPQPAGPDSPLVGWLLIGVGAVAYVSQLAVYFPQNDDYAGQDEEAYLMTATEVRNAGGSMALLSELYTGRFAEANRHPLYIWLLSFRPDFEAGKWLSVGLGCLVLVGVVALGVRRRQWVRTGILCLLLGLNSAFARFSVIVGCEVLLVGIVGLFWLWLEVPAESTYRGATVRADLRLAGFSAVALATAWLTKGTGLLLTLGCVLWLWVCLPRDDSGDSKLNGLRRWPRRTLLVGCFGVIWMVVASPLLTRNALRFHHPLHNVNTWLLFVDEYQDPVELSQAMTVSEAAVAYLGTHTWSEIALREMQGLIWEGFILLRALGPPPWDDARILPGAVVAALATIGILVERRRQQLLLMLWLLLCVPFFAWYIPIAAGERFVIPLLIPLLSCAADGSLHCLRLMRSGARCSVGQAS